MNRKERRIAQLQKRPLGMIQLNGKVCTIEEAAGLAMHEENTKNFQFALEIYDLILIQLPNHAAIYNNRAAILNELRRYDEALTSCCKAIGINPDLAEAYNNKGNALRSLRYYADALANYDKAITLKPNYAKAYNNQGLTLHDLKRYDEALASFDKAIAIKPDYAEAYNNKGVTFQELKQYKDAQISYDKAIALKPDYAEAYSNQGSVLQELKKYEEAVISYDKAMAIKPEIHYLAGASLFTRLYHCKWEGFKDKLNSLANDIKIGKPVSSPFEAAVMGLSSAQQKKCAEIYIQDKFPPRENALWDGKRYSHDKIRVGYFSADFQNHATTYLMAQLFELHDRSRFGIAGFSFGPPSTDTMRERVEKAFDLFVDISTASDTEIAALARKLEIDIAIDLKGFTTNSRPGIFAQRVAPIQVNYLGYPGTMGASYIDYLIADSIVIPEKDRKYYTEKIAYLPNSYQVNDSSRKISEKIFTRKEVGLPEDSFVFCCFNNNYKVTPEVFDIWMRLLQKVDGSVLWLFKDNQAASKNIRIEAQLRGVDANRLVFAPRMDLAEHLARHRLADLFLDTFYCNAHTTASDALWAGLPVLTCLGETFAGRVAASLLHAIDLPELITHSHMEYEELALDLATHSHKLLAIRDKLVQNRITKPLFNTTLFTRHIEDGYNKMWERNHAGIMPDYIYVNSSVI